MIRRPPRSTPFPTRRSSDLPPAAVVEDLPAHDVRIALDHLEAAQLLDAYALCLAHVGSPLSVRERSEEHTSELQSQFHLVCRLLLEKKKNTNSQTAPFKTLQ